MQATVVPVRGGRCRIGAAMWGMGRLTDDRVRLRPSRSPRTRSGCPPPRVIEAACRRRTEAFPIGFPPVICLLRARDCSGRIGERPQPDDPVSDLDVTMVWQSWCPAPTLTREGGFFDRYEKARGPGAPASTVRGVSTLSARVGYSCV